MHGTICIVPAKLISKTDQLDRPAGWNSSLYLKLWTVCIHLKIELSVCLLSELLSPTKALFEGSYTISFQNLSHIFYLEGGLPSPPVNVFTPSHVAKLS